VDFRSGWFPDIDKVESANWGFGYAANAESSAFAGRDGRDTPS